MARYLSGLCVAGVGLCGGGWLIVTTVLVGGAPSDASLITLATGAGVALASAVALWCWSLAWRQRMRADGVLRAVPRAMSPRQARRNRRALRRDMRRAARSSARRAGPRGARATEPHQAGLGQQGRGQGIAGIAHLVPDPRSPRSEEAAAPARRVCSVGSSLTSAPPSPAPSAPASPVPQAPPAACSPAAAPTAADASALVAELRAILEPLLAASGEGEETW